MVTQEVRTSKILILFASKVIYYLTGRHLMYILEEAELKLRQFLNVHTLLVGWSAESLRIFLYRLS